MRKVQRRPDIKDLIGKTFHGLTILGLNKKDGRAGRFVWCQCKCGSPKKSIALRSVLSETSPIQSCGCFLRGADTHGHTVGGKQTLEYVVWGSMLSRCENRKVKSYPMYGGRGIKVCSSWHKFENFLRDLGPRPNRTFTLERRDNNGNYEPKNCYWASKEQQSSNTSRNVKLTKDGITLTATQWARRLGLKPATLLRRVKDKMPIEFLFNPPMNQHRRPIKSRCIEAIN